MIDDYLMSYLEKSDVFTISQTQDYVQELQPKFENNFICELFNIFG